MRAFYNFFDEEGWHWFYILVAMIAIFFFWLHFHKPSPTVAVPAGACKAQLTGRTQVQTNVAYNCYSFDKSGACSMSIPTYYDVTYKEVRTVCDFLEWKP